MDQTLDCVFCRLLSGELEVSLVHRDDLCAAFMDIQPVTPGHVLVVPHRHVPNLTDLNREEGARMFQLGQRLATALRKSGLRCEGINFFLADGEAAGQEVFHTHLHVFPRYRGDGFGLRLPPNYSQRPGRQELNDIAANLRDVLKQTRVTL